MYVIEMYVVVRKKTTTDDFVEPPIQLRITTMAAVNHVAVVM